MRELKGVSMNADFPKDEELHALQQGHICGQPTAEQLPQVPAEL